MYPERLRRIEAFADQYMIGEKDFVTGSKDWKKYETNKKQLILIFCLD